MDEERFQRKFLTPEQAYVKIQFYCAYQERSHQEVKTKLAGYGIAWTAINPLMAKLIEGGFLNEERFAKAFTGGRFRSKDWGKKKIEAELKKRMVSTYSIQKALREEIDPQDYAKTVQKLIEKKWKSLRGPGNTQYVKQAKTRQYLLSRGFEHDIVARWIKQKIQDDADTTP